MRRFLVPVVILAALSWSLWGSIVWKLPPDALRNKIFFFASFFLAAAFSFTYIFFLLRDIFERVKSQAKTKENFGKALRRGLLAAVYIVGAGVLQLLGAVNIFNLVIFALILLLAEISLTISK